MVMAGRCDRLHSEQVMVRISGELAWLLKQLHHLQRDGEIRKALADRGEDVNRCSVMRLLIDPQRLAQLRAEVLAARGPKRAFPKPRPTSESN